MCVDVDGGVCLPSISLTALPTFKEDSSISIAAGVAAVVAVFAMENALDGIENDAGPVDFTGDNGVGEIGSIICGCGGGDNDAVTNDDGDDVVVVDDTVGDAKVLAGRDGDGDDIEEQFLPGRKFEAKIAG